MDIPDAEIGKRPAGNRTGKGRISNGTLGTEGKGPEMKVASGGVTAGGGGVKFDANEELVSSEENVAGSSIDDD